MASKLTLTTVAAAFAAASTIGLVSLTPTAALAYKTQADCEAHEGAGNCKNCPIAQGDPGWHNKSACNSIKVSGATARDKAKLLAKVDSEEKAKVDRAKQKAR